MNGEEGEENLTPVVHYHMLDTITHSGSRIINLCHRGIAKALSVDAQVITPMGNVRMGDLKVGDTVVSRNGVATTITHKSETFIKQLYEICLVDGRKLVVSEDHINIVQKRRTGKRSLEGFNEYNLTTQEIINKGVRYTKKVSDRCPSGSESKWFVPTAKAAQLPEVDFPLDPYMVGVILGDGSIDKASGFTRVYTHVDDLQHFLDQCPYPTSAVRNDKRRPDTYRFSITGIGPTVIDFIGTENVYGKRVPHKLLWGSTAQRLAVLQGLMDTDGTIHSSNKSTTSFTTVSEGLANDVMWLVRSLGGEAKYTHNQWTGTTSYRVYIRLDVCPFRLKRKADLWVPNVIGRTGILSITPLNTGECQCIAVDDPTESYLAEGYFVTHNTTVMGEYLFLFIACYGVIPGFGKVSLALYVSDSIENGVKNMRKNLEFRWENSEFLREYVPFTRFTDIRWEFKNKEGHPLIVKGYGAKALSLDTELHTATGRITIEDCRVGDKIVGADGKLSTIVEKSEVFNRPMYELVLEDGRSLKISDEHYNPVFVNTQPNGVACWEDKTLTTLELLEQPLTHTKIGNKQHRGVSTKHLVKVKNISAIDYSDKDFPIDPYTLGVVLGDGRIRKDCGSVELTCHVDELPHYHNMVPYEFGSLYKDPRSNAVTQSIRGIGRALKCLEVNVRGELKFIPDTYMYGSITQRLALLQGLLDTDGTISGKGRISFTSSSHQLCDDVACLVRSLGGSASYVNKHSHAEAYRIEIWMEVNPFKLARKATRFIAKTKHMNVVALKRIADEPSQCIAIDNEDKQFIADCYFRTHNTGVRGAKEMGKRPVLAVLDDLISDEDARSATVIAAVEDTVYKAVTYALHPRKNMIIWSGTPFNSKDPLYKAVESGAWQVNVFPVCERFPCTKEEFRGSWPDRFTYEYVLQQYETARKLGKVDTFNQELMLQIMSDDDRLITDNDIRWYKRNKVLESKGAFNFYVTTDFATSDKKSADFSVISVWALNSVGDWFWVDGICRRQQMGDNVNDLFRLCQEYRPQSVGIEVSGQQAGFIPWLQDQMIERNIWFPLASQNNSGSPGIRPNTAKFERFMVVEPMFKSGKFYFPVEMRTSPIMVEAMDELRLISIGGFKSKHDDFIDTISMLPLLNTWKPSGSGVDVMSPNTNSIWDNDFDEDDLGSRMSSYIV